MPVAPRKPYLKSICTVCGWSELTKQHSDVLALPRQCRKCSGKLTLASAGLLESLAVKPLAFLQEIFRKN